MKYFLTLFTIISLIFPFSSLKTEKKLDEEVEKVLLVKRFGEEKYQVTFPNAPKKTYIHGYMDYSAKSSQGTYRLTYYPSYQDYLHERKRLNPRPIQEKIQPIEEGVLVLSLENGSEKSFQEFFDSFAKIRILPT